jgi:hypothetical protein
LFGPLKRLQRTGTNRVVVPGRQWRKKPEKQAKHGRKRKDWQTTGPDGGVSRMPYAPEGATRIE